MTKHARIEPGASVETTDGTFGTVREVLVNPKTRELSQLLVEHDESLVLVPVDLILDIVGPTQVRLSSTRADALARLSGIVSTPDLGGQVRVPIYEERLRVGIRSVDRGEVVVRKSVEHVPETVVQPVERDEVEIERIRLDRPIDQPARTREEDGWLIVPVMEEVLVVTKQLVLTEEVRIRTRRVLEEQEVYEIVRHERIDVKDTTGADNADESIGHEI
ncbi:MAG: YsnF/AvaK domain-containing protein [Chloroflexota bacterium]